MNTFTTATGIVHLQSQQLVTDYPSPFTVSPPPMVVWNWEWQQISTERAQDMKSAHDQDMERAGKIYAALAEEDAALAEMGLDEYADLLDHDLLVP